MNELLYRIGDVLISKRQLPDQAGDIIAVRLDKAGPNQEPNAHAVRSFSATVGNVRIRVTENDKQKGGRR
jgi:hypothetical protein